MTSLRLGTRGSQLALWQARTIATMIRDVGGPECEIVIIKTSGDRLQDAPLSEAGGKRLFVKELEDALIRGDVDLAVHSAKDMPAVLADGLTVGAVPAREDVRDAVVLPNGARHESADIADLVASLGQTPRVGTSSVRRVAQLSRMLALARFAPIRGNLDTRLRKLDAGQYDVLVLAAAGMRRLGFSERISACLSPRTCVPAPGQGALAVEVRQDDVQVRDVVRRIDAPQVNAAVTAERALVEALGGGCQVPIGAIAQPEDGQLELHAIVTSLDGGVALRADGRAAPGDARDLGRRVAADLLARGAGDLLEAVREPRAPEGNP